MFVFTQSLAVNSQMSFRRFLAVTLLACATIPSARAASYTNTASGNWTDASKWQSSSAGLSGQDTIIVFKPAAIDNSTNNNPGAFSLNQLVSVTNQAVNLYASGGSSLNFGPSSGGTLPAVTTIGTGALTVNSPITLATNLMVGSASSGAITINSNITESAMSSLIKTGTNTLTLAGANAFSGGVNILSGTVYLPTNIAWAGCPGAITLGDSSGSANATLQVGVVNSVDIITNSITVAAGASGVLSIQSYQGQAGAGDTMTCSGPLTINNNLSVRNNGGNNLITFSGATASGSQPVTVASQWGKIAFSGPVMIGDGGVTFIQNASFIAAAQNTLTLGPGNITGTGPLTLNLNNTSFFTVSATNINHSGSITNSGSGTGGITVSGNIGSNVTAVVQNSANSMLTLSGKNIYSNTIVTAGILTLTGINTNSGSTTINGGTLLMNGTNTVAAGWTGAYTVNAGGTLGGSGRIDLSAVNGLVTVNAGGKLSPGSSSGAVGTNTLALGSGSLDLSAAAGTAGTLVFDLAATNASDRINLASGTLNIGSGLLNLASFQFGGVLNPGQTTYTLITSTNLIGTLASSGFTGSVCGATNSTLAISGNNLVLTLAGFVVQPVTWKGNVSGVWDGGTTNWVVTGGSTPAYYVDTAAVTFDDTAISNLTVGSSSPVAPGSIIVSNKANAYTLSAVIGGAGSLTKAGTNTLTLTGANTFTGDVSIISGTVIVDNRYGAVAGAGGLGDSSVARNINIVDGATLQAGGAGNQNDTLGSRPAGTSSLIFNVDGGTLSIGFIGSATAWAQTVTTLNLNGGAVIMPGTSTTAFLDLNGTVTGGGSAASTMGGTTGMYGLNNTGTRTTTFNVASVGAGGPDLTISGKVTDGTTTGSSFTSSHLVKTGVGTMLLSATNTYSGTTTISNGTLLVNGTLGTGAVTVVSSGTLGGMGTVSGVVSVASGGTIAAGSTNGLGMLNVPRVAFAAGSTNSVKVTDGTNSLLNLTSGVTTLSSNVVLAVDDTGYSGSVPVLIMQGTGTGTISNNFASVLSVSGKRWSINTVGSTNVFLLPQSTGGTLLMVK